MFGVSREVVEKVKRMYPKGCRVSLDNMSDPYAPPVGTKGTVLCVDDIGTIHVAWDTGSSLGVVYGEDYVTKVGAES